MNLAYYHDKILSETIENKTKLVFNVIAKDAMERPTRMKIIKGESGELSFSIEGSPRIYFNQKDSAEFVRWAVPSGS